MREMDVPKQYHVRIVVGIVRERRKQNYVVQPNSLHPKQKALERLHLFTI